MAGRGARAGRAQQQNAPGTVKTQFQAAMAGLATIRSGQALAAQGKWKDWYRGDRKMNLAAAEDLTRQLQAALPSGER